MTSAATPAPEERPASLLPLERAFPELHDRIARVACTTLPTRVHRLDRWSDAAGADVWIKRDDETGRLYAGNKPRKLDFLLGAAVRRKKRSVMTFGGIGTNHGLATAVYAREHGLKTILLLLRQPVTAKVRHGLLLYRAAGAEMHYAPTVARLAAKALLLCARGLARGDLPYIIPTGGSSPIGVVGYVNAAFELKEQIESGSIPEPDWIFVPVGTAGTFAGLALGCRLAGLKTQVAGVLVTDILPPTAHSTAQLANRTLALLRKASSSVPATKISATDLRLITGFVGPSYGTPTPAARAARDELRELEDVHAETTYTGKCLAAVRALARVPPYRGAKLLYWHTYSGVDPAEHLGPLPDYRELPREFHAFFEGDLVQD